MNSEMAFQLALQRIGKELVPLADKPEAFARVRDEILRQFVAQGHAMDATQKLLLEMQQTLDIEKAVTASPKRMLTSLKKHMEVQQDRASHLFEVMTSATKRDQGTGRENNDNP